MLQYTPAVSPKLQSSNTANDGKFDLSIVVPAIRTTRWEAFYDSILKSCKKYSWQLVFISPFDLPDNLKNKLNIKLIKNINNNNIIYNYGNYSNDRFNTKYN